MDGREIGMEARRETSYGSTQQKEINGNIQDENVGWKFWRKRRLVVGVLAFFGFFISYILRVNLSVAIVAMTSKSDKVRKSFNCGAFISQTIFMTASAFVGSPTAAVACITIAVGLGGFAWSGFSVNHLDIAPQHASILMGIGNTIATIPGIVSPIITGYIVKNKTRAEWRIVFIIAGIIYLIGAIIYGLFASGERQKWAEEPDNKDKELPMYINQGLEIDECVK